jgi:hypothetical protein
MVPILITRSFQFLIFTIYALLIIACSILVIPIMYVHFKKCSISCDSAYQRTYLILAFVNGIVFFRCQILLIHYLYSPSCGNLQHMVIQVLKFSSQLYIPGHSLHHIVKTIYVSKSPTRQYS